MRMSYTTRNPRAEQSSLHEPPSNLTQDSFNEDGSLKSVAERKLSLSFTTLTVTSTREDDPVVYDSASCWRRVERSIHQRCDPAWVPANNLPAGGRMFVIAAQPSS